MVKIVVKFKILEGMEEAYLNDLKPCILATRQEEGCLRYDYFFAAEDPDVLLLVELWADTDTHQAHCATELFAKLQALKPQFCDSSDVLKLSHE